MAALEAGAAFFALISIPREVSGGFLFGFSFSRLLMLSLLLAFAVFWGCLAVLPPKRISRYISPAAAYVSAFLSIFFATLLFLLRYREPGRLAPYFERLSPLLWYLLLVSLQGSFFILFLLYGVHPNNIFQRRRIYLTGLIALALLLSILVFVAISRVGITPDSAYWGEPGVPIMGWQFGLALLGGLFFFLIPVGWISTSRVTSILIPVVIWFIAVIIWLNVPISVMQNSFYAPIGPPANQSFPNSDAGYYDSMAQSLMIGYPYQGDIPTRPLFIAFLAAFHLLVGEHYDLIVACQTMLLALIPVILYFMASKLHSRAAGVIVALIAIFREWTSLLISSQTRVSNTKTLLVDLPTLLLLCLACLFALIWLQKRDWKSAVTAGGLFGILFLLRTQSMLILPFLFLVAILVYWPSKQHLALGLAAFLSGLVVAVLPWLIHNYLHTGQLIFDAPFQYRVIASQYQYTGNLDINKVDLQGKSLFGILWTFALHDPKFVIGFITTHFLATQIDGVLVLPLVERYNGLFAPLNLYWMNWNGNLSAINLILVLLYLGLIALGLAAAWRRWRWIGLTPLAFSVGYALANGVARFSGWRYDLPADWIAYFYLAFGVVEIFTTIAWLFGKSGDSHYASIENAPVQSAKWQTAILLLGILGLIGAIPWMAERLASPRYGDQTASTLVSQLASSAAVQRLGVTDVQIKAFASAPKAALQIGRVLYPRYFTRGTGLASAHPWPAYSVQDFPRLGFLLLNQTRKDVFFPTRAIPDPFPQAADAIVLGCQHTDYIEARLIFLPGIDSAYLNAPLTTMCN